MAIQLVHTAPERSIAAPPASILVAEAHHRITNSLALIMNLVRLQASGIEDDDRPMDGDEVRLILQEFGGRVATVARFHCLLADAEPGAPIDLAAFLQDVAETVMSTVSSADQMELRFDCDIGCLLPPEMALPLGLIVGELTTNAVKYAHPTGVAGKIGVGCHRNSADMIVVEVADDGVGLPEGFDPETDGRLGFRLIRSLVDQIAANCSHASSELGLSFVLKIPAHPSTSRRYKEGWNFVPNNHYRCYFTDDDDRIRAVEQIACEGDADAVLKVEHLPAASIYRTAELWQGARLVGK
jgi:two-component sensor histidine kinase